MSKDREILRLVSIICDNPQEAVVDMTLALVTLVVVSPRQTGVTSEDIRRALHKSIDITFNHMNKNFEAVK